ncbi:MAG: NAD(P)H-dependent oxidoreductase subunit E [Planctomycetota bacterium]
MPRTEATDPVVDAVRTWKDRPGSLIMALHQVQDRLGYVPRQAALDLAAGMGVPLARIYEVTTFYSFFKLESPGRAIISVCTGTACHLKGAPDLLGCFCELLGVSPGNTTDDGCFHLQGVRCVGCCGLAPVVTVRDRTYGKVTPGQIHGIIEDWRALLAQEESDES